MSRSGYSDDCKNEGLWRAAVARAVCGKRGQAFVREMAATLDAMSVKELIAGVGLAFGVARALACEIAYQNDAETK
jgi:hypothetical protein